VKAVGAWEDNMSTDLGNTFDSNKPLIFEVDMPNFPDWAIPFVKIIPKVYFDDAIDVNNIYPSDLFTQCRYWWHYIGENHWKIRVELFLSATVNGDKIPMYTDVDLVIFNERVWEENNPSKV
jgi:hypothetical protein